MGQTREGPHQTREWPPPAYDVQLAHTLEQIYSAGTYDLESVVAALNASGIASPDGSVWTQESFTATLARLGR